MPETKTCPKCKETKDLTEFYSWCGYWCKDCRRKHKQKWRTLNRAKDLYDRTRNRAKRKGILFTLKPEDVVIPDVCPILGIPLIANIGKAADNSPSLDRIVPSQGYVKENIIIISNKANRIKTDATAEEINKVAQFYLKLNS